MQKFKIESLGNKRLLIIALGWGADHHAVEQIRPEGYDILILNDYRTIEPLGCDETEDYEKVCLLAWSFGVMAAEYALGNIKPDMAIALGGTPLPVNDSHGIPHRIFRLTLSGIQSRGPEEFDRRAYGEYYDTPAVSANSRAWEERMEELNALYEQSQRQYTPSIEWRKAVIGSDDKIFPTKNMQAYWGDMAIVKEMPHYPFGDIELIESLLDDNG